ncbi:NYN domain-containing protein [Candidatus Woesearchaeota archaeon]|nr:NYN domain-containing protein [Candidatus Woesearchaeota archaeon]
MKLMIFCDLENFRHSIQKMFSDEFKVDVFFSKFYKKLIEKVVERLETNIQNPCLIRAYLYTGQYTESQINKAKKHLREIPNQLQKHSDKIKKLELNFKSEKIEAKRKKIEFQLKKEKSRILTSERIQLLSQEIENAEYRKKSQEDLFRKIGYYDLLELKLKPLKYSFKDLRFLQKGTDVEMAVDIVNFAHFNNYDVAIICTGDLDLLESCRLIKTLGKTFVLVSHRLQVGDKMIQESDYYLDVEEFSEEDFNEIAEVTPI